MSTLTRGMRLRLTGGFTWVALVVGVWGSATGASGAWEPLKIGFEMGQQGSPATNTVVALVIENGTRHSRPCEVTLTPQAYTGIVASSSAADVILQADKLSFDPLGPGATRRDVHLRFTEDG